MTAQVHSQSNTDAPPQDTILIGQSIANLAKRFDSDIGLVHTRGGGNGYHTRTTSSQVVHSTLENMNYAQLLLMRGRLEDVTLASGLLERLIALQVVDPASEHYGIWSWFVEEPPDKMAPADWNWADFMGARQAEILKTYAPLLDPSLVEKLGQSLRHAARSIVKRNIGPEYTNICAMGAGVTLAAGELLDDAALLDYGRRRLAAQRAAFEKNGGVPEYNSPSYGTIFIQEMERVLRLVSDPDARKDAEWMRRRLWELVASQYHPATRQWAGAHGRVYGDTLRPNEQLFLWLRAGIVPNNAESAKFTPGAENLRVSSDFACPPELRFRFHRLPSSPFETDQIWMPATDNAPAIRLHTWFSDSSTIGSVNDSTTWVQRRPITAYWLDDSGRVASAKLELLKNARVFASGHLRIIQAGPRLLVVFDLVPGQGDWHLYLDHPADGIFTASDLRLRLSLTGTSARCVARAAGGWFLTSGAHRLAITPGEVIFDGHPGRWENTSSDNCAQVDAILHNGSALSFAPGRLAETHASLALELLENDGSEGRKEPIESRLGGSNRIWRWAPVKGEIPAP